MSEFYWQPYYGSSFHPTYYQAPQVIPETQQSTPQTNLQVTEREKEEKEKPKPSGKETKKRERWSAEQSKVLVSLYVENNEQLESSRCNLVWPSILTKVNQHGSPKSIQQCKIKVRNLKAEYKRCKDRNKESGNSHHTCPFFEEFDAILGHRNVISMPEFGEASFGTTVPLSRKPKRIAVFEHCFE